MPNIGEIYIIGGQGLYQQCLKEYQDLCKFVILTRINKEYQADVFMPEVPKDKFSTVFLSQTFNQI